MSSTTASMPRCDGEHPAQTQRVVRRVALGHEDAEHALLAQRLDAQGGDDRAVDAAREADHGAAAAQRAHDLLPDGLGDGRRHRRGVDCEDFLREHRRWMLTR